MHDFGPFCTLPFVKAEKSTQELLEEGMNTLLSNAGIPFEMLDNKAISYDGTMYTTYRSPSVYERELLLSMQSVRNVQLLQSMPILSSPV